MRTLLLLAYFIGLPCATIAQANQPAWPKVTSVQPGQAIQIVDAHSAKHSGVFVSASDTAISYTDAAGQRSIEKPDVRSVKIVRQGRRLHHMLIGLLAGTGTGAVVGVSTWESNGFLGGKGAGTAVGAVIGAVSGTIIGASVPSHHDTVIYQASH